MSETRPYLYRVISPQHSALATLSSLFSFHAQEHTVKKHFPSGFRCQIPANHGSREKEDAKIQCDRHQSISSRSDDPNAGPDLPTELLELIFSKLNLRDSIRCHQHVSPRGCCVD